MASETHDARWTSSARAGAAPVAPTAPHGTQPVDPPKGGRKKSGPEKFWDLRRVRIAFLACAVISTVAHYILSPWSLLPHASGIELKDVDGDLVIPIDLLGEPTDDQGPKSAPPESTTPESTSPNGSSLRDAGPKPKDAGPKDAGSPSDAEALAIGDAGERAEDGGNLIAANGNGADAAVALNDGGMGPIAGGPTGSMIGMANVMTAGVVNVEFLLNVVAVRSNPIGAQMGPLLSGIPQWNDFIHGAQTNFDPIKHTDWIYIVGPSLIHTERDAIFVRYTAPDELIDHAMELVAKGAQNGGKLDTGVPGVNAVRAFADQAPRAIIRPHSSLIIVVPPDKARAFATAFRRQNPRGPVAGEAMRLIVKHPTNQISIPQLKFPDTLTELRLWVVPRASDNGADLYGEGDCTSEQAAIDVGDALRDVIRQQNSSFLVRQATRGLLNGVDISPQGTHVELHVSASAEQLNALLQVAALGMGVQLPQQPQQ